eukprot:361335-Chlamydomonas_euryale.AAC.11
MESMRTARQQPCSERGAVRVTPPSGQWATLTHWQCDPLPVGHTGSGPIIEGAIIRTNCGFTPTLTLSQMGNVSGGKVLVWSGAHVGCACVLGHVLAGCWGLHACGIESRPAQGGSLTRGAFP